MTSFLETISKTFTGYFPLLKILIIAAILLFIIIDIVRYFK